MASRTQAQRFIKLINQQIDLLKGERKTVLEAVDEAVNQVQSEVDTWVNEGHVNQTTWAQMNNRIQQVINLFMTKSVEISDLEMKENESDLNQTSSAISNDSIIPGTTYARDEAQERTMMSSEDTRNKSGVDIPYITTTRFSILEEVVLSLKKTTEKIQEKQETVNKKIETLTSESLKSDKKFQERQAVMERSIRGVSSNVDHLLETVTNFNVKLNRLEEENKSVSVSMNELNEQISSVDACSNVAYMSIQDLSKSVESTNQHLNEMSDKMNQLEISMNLMTTQYREQFENMDNFNKDKVDDLIGMVCQLLSKRLAPLETLHETLNKKLILSKEHILKINCRDEEVAKISS
ncbi:unnamed protein product [Lymnaea stagnalis]|uniref:Uncharacterized protein n=1 Tax=Lymnaea stagnalis TaxID=6523 RepID=A0AAV2IBS8_LYMST